MNTQPPQPLYHSDIPHIHILNTAIASDNIGDEIIMECALKFIVPIFSDAYVSTSASHDGLGSSSRVLAESADIVFLVGSNALAPFYHEGRPFIWSVSPEDRKSIRGKLVLFGVGANRAFSEIDKRQIDFLADVLSESHLHSVRDRLGLDIVLSTGRRAVDTCCPTLWQYRENEMRMLNHKAQKVCFTLTKHKPHPNDTRMIEILSENYDELIFWPQQPRDLDYLRSIFAGEGVKILPPNLQAYDNFLRSEEVDVIGTRLHGTIRGLHHNRRSIVVSIDARAQGVHERSGLVVVDREKIEILHEQINCQSQQFVYAPNIEISSFLGQF